MSDLPIRCQDCPFKFTKLVGHKGPLDAPLVCVGESPGEKELRDGIPFIGPSGKVLDEALLQNPNIPTLFLNAMQCWPGRSNDKDIGKVAQAAKACQHRLHSQILQHPRKAILALGNGAAWALTNNFSSKITQIRGKRYDSTLAQGGIVTAVHPAFLLRGGGSLRQFLADVHYAQQLTFGNDLRKFVIPRVEVVESLSSLLALANDFKRLPPSTMIAGDSETGGYNGFDHLRDRILCAGFSVNKELVYVIPESLIRESGPLFDNAARFVWHHGKFDAKFFRAAGVSNVRVDDDTMMLSYALDETKGIHDLETVGGDIIGVPDWKFMIQPYLDDAKKSKRYNKYGNVTYDCIPKPILYDYMARDISTCLQVFPYLREQVEKNPHLEKLYTRTLMPLSNYYMRIEEAGIHVSMDAVASNDARLLKQIQQHCQVINKIAQENGFPEITPKDRKRLDIAPHHTHINVNSWQQVQDLMYKRLKLPTKFGQSTDKDTLEKLPQVPFVKSLRLYRVVQKQRSTYVVNLPQYVNIDGRVHSSYKIHGTTTGRPAGEDPNLLNIARNDLIKSQYQAESCDDRYEGNCGNILLEVDVNQAELRVLTEFSRDVRLTKIYTTKGMSIHDETTKKLFGTISEYTPEYLEKMIIKFNVQDNVSRLYGEQKMKAKNVNFGIPYGITAAGLAEQCDSTVAEATIWLDQWHEAYPEATRFINQCREAPRIGKSLVTPFGRMRRFGVVSPERIDDLMNQAANFPEQSAAVDIVHHTGLAMLDHLYQYKAVIVNTVYDSILYECPNDPWLYCDLAKQTIRTLAIVAKDWGFRTIPIVGEAKVGKMWGNMKELHLDGL